MKTCKDVIHIFPLQQSDVADYISHHDRPDILHAICSQTPIGTGNANRWYEKYRLIEGYSQLFTIKLQSLQTVGYIGFPMINRVMNNAHVLYFITSDLARNRGYATDALCQLLDYGFSNLNLNEVLCTVRASNTASMTVAENCGLSFVETYYKEEIEMTLMIITSEEWQNTASRRTFFRE